MIIPQVQAQSPTPKGIYNPVIGPLGRDEPTEVFAALMAKILSSLFIIGALMLIFMIVWAAYDWITAGGEAQRLEAAQKRLTYAIIGFVLLVGLRVIVGFIGTVLQVPFLETLKVEWPTF